MQPVAKIYQLLSEETRQRVRTGKHWVLTAREISLGFLENVAGLHLIIGLKMQH